MGYLIDVAAMKNVVFSGFGSYCDTIISPMNEMYDGKTPAEPTPVDVEKAKAVYSFSKAMFANRRKTIYNNLQNY